MFGALFNGDKRSVLLKAGIMVAAIAVLDWWVVGKIPLGFLYLVPMLMVGGVLSRWQICAAAGVCSVLAEAFDDLPWNLREGIPRDVLYLAAFVGTGLFVHEMNSRRGAALEHLHEIERQSDARLEAEEQLSITTLSVKDHLSDPPRPRSKRRFLSR
jgi:hypothetical protein